MKHVTLDNGTKIGVFSAAPASFNPLSASATDLRRFGFPPVPTDAVSKSRYEQLFNQVKGRLHYVEPQFKIIKHQLPGSIVDLPPLAPAAPVRNIKLCGARIVGSTTDPFKWMQGDWVVPNASGGSQKFCAFWLGLHGSSGPVYQAGVHMQGVGTHNTVVQPFWQWIDIQGNGVSLDVTSFQVSPGDMISTILCTDQGTGSTSGTIYFLNLTNGSHTSFTTHGPALQTQVAEWNVGFPFLFNGNASTVANFGEVYFSNCNAVTNAFALRNSGSGEPIVLIENPSTNAKIVANSTLLTDNIVHCRYLGL